MPVLNPLEISAARGATNAGATAGLALPGDRVKRIAIVGDSFVDGAGVTMPDTFGTPLAALLRARYGDAGSGYIPWLDSKMAGLSHSANWLSVSPTGPGTAYYRWDETHKRQMFNGMGYYRDGGVGGLDGSESMGYAPNVADSFGRGVIEVPTATRIYATIRSANTGFQLRQQDILQTSAPTFSSGASFTGSVAATTLTASAVTGTIARQGVRVFGGVTSTTITTAGGSNSGSAGTYGVNVSQTVGSQAMTSDPNISTLLNIPQSITYYPNPANNNNLRVVGVYGDMVVSGVENYNGNAGVTVTNFGQGGALAYQFASLDDAAQRAYWKQANFDLVIVVLGMNDRSQINPNIYGASQAKLISWIQECPRSKVILARQTDASDAVTSFQSSYTAVLQNLAMEFGCGFIDERNASADFATYSAAVTAGLMFDGVHRNGAGNTIIGNYYNSQIAGYL